ncbi:MAG: divergent polysaccharide deacetylase family protein [Proteobacteria bacterium]|nr:divergent polysaccharide deacetylase family protein [Pseudomonadota bacterium]
MIHCRYLVIAALLALVPPASAESIPRIAIIIDDLGYQLEAGRRAIELPGPVAYAILPGTPSGRALAETAHRNGKEVLLHLPLEAIAYRGPAEPGGITLDMSRSVFQETFAAALMSVPFAIGVSSHRGSLLTRHPGHMEWLMEEIRSREGLFFVDSYTTHESVALQIAAEAGVVATKRDVFLDNDRSEEALAFEFERLQTLARIHGVAMGIGHPYPETLAFLERELQALDDEEIALVSVSELMRIVAGGIGAP